MSGSSSLWSRSARPGGGRPQPCPADRSVDCGHPGGQSSADPGPTEAEFPVLGRGRECPAVGPRPAPTDTGGQRHGRAVPDRRCQGRSASGRRCHDHAAPDSEWRGRGRHVDIRADVTPAVLARIRDLGGTVLSSIPKYRAIGRGSPSPPWSRSPGWKPSSSSARRPAHHAPSADPRGGHPGRRDGRQAQHYRG